MERWKWWVAMVLGMMLTLVAGTAWAAETDREALAGSGNDTEVQAGVVVDYMGKLRFEVYKKGTTTPIEGASVELYIPSLDRYVLFGLTDADGAYEVNIAYNMDPGTDLNAQFEDVDGTPRFEGNLLFLDDNQIKYQVYKSKWLPYPSQGETVLAGNKIPHVVTVYLYQSDGSSGGKDPVKPGTPGSNSGGNPSSPIGQLLSLLDEMVPLSGLLEENPPTGGIPKTGVEGAVPYWIAGMVFFISAGGILGYLLKKEKEIKTRERR